jgi:UDP-N-acetylmuramoylalanine--D-glutamate ligase
MISPSVVIIGAAESGIGAALLAKRLGHQVFVSDGGKIKNDYRELLQSRGIDFEESGHTLHRLGEASLCIKSPGVANEAEVITALKQKGIPVISEIEFAASQYKGKSIGITGSNGKTTTTLLAHHLLREAGISAGLAGNVGKSFAAAIAEGGSEPIYVLEVSSFQLDDCYSFHPHIAMILNITPDHLDRYGYVFERYADAKFRIVQNSNEEDYFIYHKENPGIKDGLKRHQVKARHLPLSLFPLEGQGAWCDHSHLHFQLDSLPGGLISIPYEGLPLEGQHNQLNMMAAGLAALLSGLNADQLKFGLKNFKNAPHRMEPVGDLNGVSYVNDSKATNVDSVFYALGSMKKPVVWIAGGVDKGNDYSQIEALVKDKVKALVCMGTKNEPLISYFSGKVPTIKSTASLAEALSTARALAAPGDIVLLSPACASFDLFKNYEDRGDQFRAAVQSMIQSAP